MGTGWVKTGMGKINESDTRNSWTLVMDSDTFSGPIGYVLPDAWQVFIDCYFSEIMKEILNHIFFIQARDIDWESKTAHLQDFSNAPEVSCNVSLILHLITKKKIADHPTGCEF